MSLSKRINGRGNEPQAAPSPEDEQTLSRRGRSYIEQINRLKTLSKAQTALLKAHLQTKITRMNGLLRKALDALKHSGRYNGLYAEIESGLALLKLHELEVDVKSVQLELSAELAILREAVENPPPVADVSDEEVQKLTKEIDELKSQLAAAKSRGAAASSDAPPPLPAPGGLDGVSADKIRSLESDNVALRGLLKEAKNELVDLNVRMSKMVTQEEVTKAAASSAAANAEIEALKREVERSREQLREKNGAAAAANSSEVESLRQEVSRTQAGLNEKSGECAALSSQLGALKAELMQARDDLTDKLSKISLYMAEIAALKSASASAGSDAEKLNRDIADLKRSAAAAAEEYQAKLAAQQKKLTLEGDARVSELEKRLETEKEEMMEALAQEVEDVEKRLNDDKNQLTAENERLAAERATMAKSFGAMKNSNRMIISKLGQVKSSARELGLSKNRLSEEVKKYFTDFKSDLRTQFSQPVMFKLRGIDAHIGELKKKYKREMMERKKLHNVIQELKGNIRVYLRCRPPTTREIEQFGDDALCVSFPDDGQIRVVNDKGREKIWDFDEVFGLDSTQEAIYPEVSELVTSVLDGYNVCIFAYGQTGSGKTYTMAGPDHDRGVNLRALNELFEKSTLRTEESRDTIQVSVLEVYNEMIHDLLVASNDEKLEIRQGEFGNYVPGLSTVPVNSLAEVRSLLQTADRNRSQACTNMNEHSSRSHMILSVSVISENLATGVVSRGKLHLVDLAGSERLDKSGATGQALKEAQNINKSLSALGDVIQARAQKQGHVPFRNSTLTYLLQDSLSQDSKTLMFVCISPVLYNADESFCSLNFAARVKTVELGRASKNVSAAKAPAAAGSGKPPARKPTPSPVPPASR